jgi:hypothetical protein|uniref:Uncharacterized protein n=1 Tax=viral metagenome TaxID=1070528 RepID=A0A6C0BRU2_9ZZZZ
MKTHVLCVVFVILMILMICIAFLTYKSKTNIYSSKSKVCVLISGPFRDANTKSVQSIIDNVIKPLNADVFVFTWKKNYKRNPYRRLKGDNYYDLTKSEEYEYDDKYIKMLNPISVVKEVLKDPTEYYNGGFNKNIELLNNHTPLSSIYMHYGWKRCFDLVEETNVKYDLVVRVRPDLMFDTKLQTNEITSLESIYLSKDFTSYYTMSDKFFICNVSNFKKILKVIDKYPIYWRKDTEALLKKYSINNINGEKMMRLHIHEMGLQNKVKVLKSPHFKIL